MTDDRATVLSWLVTFALAVTIIIGLTLEWAPVVYPVAVALVIGLLVVVFLAGAFIVAAIWALFTGHFPRWFL